MSQAKNDRISSALDRCYEQAERISLDASDLRLVIFSDHHRGVRDGADDFLPCETTYRTALEHYDKLGYQLCLLGDVEEFWENSIFRVLNAYKDLVTLEGRFHQRQALWRIWGNHDDEWRIFSVLDKHLGRLLPRLRAHEALVVQFEGLEIQRDILLVHGHQGTLDSDRFAWFSRVFVRYVWRNIQRLFRIPLNTPSRDLPKRTEHDRAMFTWASSNDCILISGHTHRPIFMSSSHMDRLKKEIEESDKELEKEALEAKMEEVRQLDGESPELDMDRPLYFNTGCCSFSDGDITGIELAEHEIRLIKWTGESKIRMVLESFSLEDLMKCL